MRFRHGNFTFKAAFSPDGKVLASSGVGMGVCLWDAGTGCSLYQLPIPWWVPSLAFSPDGKELFLATYLQVIDVATGTELRRCQGSQGDHNIVAYAPDGRMVAASERKDVLLWDPATGRELHRLTGHTGEVQAIAFSPDGKLLASGAQDKVVRLWDIATGTELRRLDGHDGTVFSIAFAPGGKVLASAGHDSTVRFWDVGTGKALHLVKGREGGIRSIAFSPDGKLLASGEGDGTVCVRDAASGKDVRRWPAHLHPVYSVAFSPDAKTLVSTGGWDNVIRLWDVGTGIDLHPPAGHIGKIKSLRFAPGGDRLFSVGEDRQVLVWDTAAGTVSRRLRGGSAGKKTWGPVALSPDEKTLALAEWEMPLTQADSVVRLWDTANGQERHTLRKHANLVRILAYSPDGRLLASGDREGVVYLWDAATGAERYHWKEGQKAQILSLAFSPDSSLLSSGGSNGAIHLWETASGKELRRWERPREWIYEIAFTSGSRLLASSDQNTIRVWDISTGKEVRRFIEGSQWSGNRNLVFSPSGRYLAAEVTGDTFLPNGDRARKGAIQLWETLSGKEVHTIPERQHSVWSLAFAPDGRTLATGGGDSTILLWDLTGRGSGGRLTPARLTAVDLDGLWDKLGGEAPGAYRAAWALVAAPDQAVKLLAAHLRPAAAVEPQRLAGLVADLDSDGFAVRERAYKDLERLGELAEPALNQVVASSKSAEVRRRAEELLDKALGPVTAPERLRSFRSIEVLEQVGNTQAEQLLQTLSTGAAHARLTREAKGSLERLRTRHVTR